MKHFAIGDGHKRISLPDCYRANHESDETTIFWNPEYADIPIRASVITVTPKDKYEEEAAFWSTIDRARAKNSEPTIDGNKAVYAYREESTGPGDAIHFYHVGLGNHYCIFSITVSKTAESGAAFNQTRTDVEATIHSLVERGNEEQFSCCLQEYEYDRINESVSSLIPSGLDDSAWSALQEQLDRAYDERDEDLARRVGLVFGEMMKREIPSFAWSVKIDDNGNARALDLGESGISIFPEDMILKRFDRAERLNLSQFASDTIDTIEMMYRKYQEEN